MMVPIFLGHPVYRILFYLVFGRRLISRWCLLPPPRRLCFRRRCLFVCLLATLRTDLVKFSGKVGNGTWTKDYIFVPISHRFARRRDWYRDTGKTCLGGRIHCPSSSSLYYMCDSEQLSVTTYVDVSLVQMLRCNETRSEGLRRNGAFLVR